MCRRQLRLVALLTLLCLLLSGCHRTVLPEDSMPDAEAADFVAAEDAAEDETEDATEDTAEAKSRPVLSSLVVEAEEGLAEKGFYPGPSPIEPEEVLPEADFDLVFYFGTAAGVEYEYAIAPEDSEEWVSLESGWAGTCGDGDINGYIGTPFTVGKYMMNFTGETGALWQLRATDSESGELVNCWHNVPITDNKTRLIYYYTDANGYFQWYGQDLLVVDSMLFCTHCPEAWSSEPTAFSATDRWFSLAIMGETVNPFIPVFELDPADIHPPSEPEGEHLQPDSAFDLVVYAHPTSPSGQYFIAPEGNNFLEQPMSGPMPDTAQHAFAGACQNEYIYGLQTRMIKYQFDFSGQTGDLWQIRFCYNEMVYKRGTIGTWHNIPITDTDTYLTPIQLPGSSYFVWTLLVAKAQFCESCPKGWQETNGK